MRQCEGIIVAGGLRAGDILWHFIMFVCLLGCKSSIPEKHSLGLLQTQLCLQIAKFYISHNCHFETYLGNGKFGQSWALLNPDHPIMWFSKPTCAPVPNAVYMIPLLPFLCQNVIWDAAFQHCFTSFIKRRNFIEIHPIIVISQWDQVLVWQTGTTRPKATSRAKNIV